MLLSQHELDVLAVPTAGQLQRGHAVDADGADGGAGHQQGGDDSSFVPMPVSTASSVDGVERWVGLDGPLSWRGRWTASDQGLSSAYTSRAGLFDFVGGGPGGEQA